MDILVTGGAGFIDGHLAKRLVSGGHYEVVLDKFNYSHRVQRATLMLTTGFLKLVLPLYTVAIRRHPRARSQAVIVGDDPETMAEILAASDLSITGYISPRSSFSAEESPSSEPPEIAAGGRSNTS
jgi:hypothetical protein